MKLDCAPRTAQVWVLDTSFIGAVLLRSMTCGARVHFGASSTGASNRDKPMLHEDFLHVLMHDPLPPGEKR